MIARKIPLAAQPPPCGLESDSDEADQAYERAWWPQGQVQELVAACDLPERERGALEELLSPASAIWLVHVGDSALGYQNGRHRAHALLSAGVRWVPVIRDHCCSEAQDCSPRYCHVQGSPLSAEHIAGCELNSGSDSLSRSDWLNIGPSST